MLQSVISRFAFLFALAMLVLVVPIFYFINAEATPVKAEPKALAASQSNDFGSVLTESTQGKEPVIKLSSLTESSSKPSLEILKPVRPLNSDTIMRVETASTLAKRQRFDEALEELDRVHSADRDIYEVRFLEARILAWSGQHERAENEFSDLIAQYPQDLDVLVSLGYLRFYQRDYSQSEDIFTQVLALNADYEDARTGLQRSRRAQNKAN